MTRDELNQINDLFSKKERLEGFLKEIINHPIVSNVEITHKKGTGAGMFRHKLATEGDSMLSQKQKNIITKLTVDYVRAVTEGYKESLKDLEEEMSYIKIHKYQ